MSIQTLRLVLYDPHLQVRRPTADVQLWVEKFFGSSSLDRQASDNQKSADNAPPTPETSDAVVTMVTGGQTLVSFSLRVFFFFFKLVFRV